MHLVAQELIHDTGFQLWGGSVSEGLSKDSHLCPGSNVMAAYLDNTLPVKVRKIVENHMASCRECRRDVYELRKIIEYAFGDEQTGV